MLGRIWRYQSSTDFTVAYSSNPWRRWKQGKKSIGTNYRFRASFDWEYRSRAGHNSLHQELLHVLSSRTALQ
ncbi:hypothetical protein BDV33DRAFT_174547 [Aspergillus novoparasiticus]|uniref:Uncharacterized protein n=1 Tax=Aspergillus novoparasiticus TaxID=986946 RepID=A0A5N6EMZ3_9EURO|nr:hypothetical protein BDV33DRAFT_174547 [Aspergillus novoparasiticus]